MSIYNPGLADNDAHTANFHNLVQNARRSAGLAARPGTSSTLADYLKDQGIEPPGAD
jgi:hypothetical protein